MVVFRTDLNLAGAAIVVTPLAMMIAIIANGTENRRAIVSGTVVVTLAYFAVLFVVRWINRRDDPRHARHPPDAP
jgi:steroid 5-alpha reductase family enzyme